MIAMYKITVSSAILFLVLILKNVTLLNAMVVASSKRSISAETNMEDYASPADALQSNFDEYPMVVPKRAAMLLDRLMVALHHALEDERNGHRRIGDIYSHGKTLPVDSGFMDDAPDFTPQELSRIWKNGLSNFIPEEPVWEIREAKPEMDVGDHGGGATLMAKSFQRRAPEEDGASRANGRGRVYWRCYFNAVSCF